MYGQTGALPILDHIVILVAHSTLESLPSKLSGFFVVARGGFHADGLTANKLILFEDGAYIELIAFVDGLDPDQRRQHRWGQLPEAAIIDWAYTLTHEAEFAAVQQRVAQSRSGLVYSDPVPGGRTKPDGTTIKWAVAAARGSDGNPAPPGSMPFWCLDRTPRSLRVPYDQEHRLTQHPCGAQGVSSLAVSVPVHEVAALGEAYDAIHGSSSDDGGAWKFKVFSGSAIGKHTVSVSVSERAQSIELVLHGDSATCVEVVAGVILRVET
ncbi:glyoxalase-like domain-containing protein [Hirsutella rhossiliensis]|uniref:Glyoxalase-like domain-containing protein n=1 Tax=Hirsutella rhossiliensis TaxID=111463 RepID=A0A9P8N0V1_9HYPO|nr:glyoxalase-like domain-containing protein [Hirsutella rhossiliensis]KAH0966068.1 glyoxalase-like domain-containing protein [Hirsutella rhossiliensis]